MRARNEGQHGSGMQQRRQAPAGQRRHEGQYEQRQVTRRPDAVGEWIWRRYRRWLWRVVDVRGIDRMVVESGHQSVGLAQWLWETVDVRQIEKGSDQIGRAADASGKKLNDVEPRTIQHHLGVLIAWLVAAILFFYWLVL